jgi:hypothetical protein
MKVENIARDIIVALDNVATVNLRDRQKLKDLVDKAGRLWLEACSQRYRIVVKVPPKSEDVLTKATYSHETLTLVIRPALRRYGNSQGLDLEHEDIVGDWQEMIELYSTRP